MRTIPSSSMNRFNLIYILLFTDTSRLFLKCLIYEEKYMIFNNLTIDLIAIDISFIFSGQAVRGISLCFDN